MSGIHIHVCESVRSEFGKKMLPYENVRKNMSVSRSQWCVVISVIMVTAVAHSALKRRHLN